MSKESTAAESLFFAGNRHLAANELSEAEVCFRKAIGLAPGLAEAHANLGLLLDQSGMDAEAEHHYRRSIGLDPDCGQMHLNLGALLAKQKRFEEAETAYRRALDLMPGSPAAWSNLGVLQACRKQEQAGELSYRTAIALDSEHRLAYFNLAYLLLRQGRYEEGWRCFEKRDWYAHLEKMLPCPRWRGESLKGKSLLIGFEAGHGDMIQFCRYAPILKEQGAARITLICHPALTTLFTTLGGVDAVHGFDETLPPAQADFWTPPLSIPFHCQTRLDSIPADLPYLRADSRRTEMWAVALARECAPGDLRVGLVWKGNPRFENDADRSLPSLSTLESLGTISGLRYFSLQKGAGEDEAASPPAGLPLVDLGPRLADFAETAAVVANLDLVVCVDTAVAHLAGAMGKKCCVLLPDYKADWRWLDGRADSPWYPGVVRLFRQPEMGDWSTPVAELLDTLKTMVAAPSRGWQ